MASLRPGEFVWTLEGKSQPYKISIADGATVTLSDATINGTSERVCKTSSGRYTSCDWAGLTCLGNQKKEYSTPTLGKQECPPNHDGLGAFLYDLTWLSPLKGSVKLNCIFFQCYGFTGAERPILLCFRKSRENVRVVLAKLTVNLSSFTT